MKASEFIAYDSTKSQTYRVAWYVDIDADSPLEAAQIALGMQRDAESIATIFTVKGACAPICIDAATGETFESDES